jgi:hypothetical protein
MDAFRRPSPDEYNTHYAGYVRTVPDGPILDFLKVRRDELAELLRSVPPDLEAYRYAPGKWSVREVAGHVIDSERVFAYRALAFARGAADPLPGMDQDAYAAAAPFGDRTLASIADEFVTVRDATISLVQSFGPEIADRGGVASGYPVTVRALVWIIAGHERHHAYVLADRYLTR